ncbi:MAG: OmpA family protein [Bacteroidales bacterium]|nr:OmpA family protein [Bacteroidales bacterium]
MSEIEQEHYGDYAMVNGDYQTMKNVRHYWVSQAQRLKFLKQVEFNLTGSNESILKVTIPDRMLFAQNDSTMLISADAYLRPLLRLVKGPDAVATMIIASYSDNNGSEKYLQLISGSRARQVYRWFARQGVGPNDMHCYGWANKVPRNENNNIQQREKNRRVSLYFVPNRKMLRWAKRGQL